MASIKGVATWVLAGVAIGLLTAPRSGKATRDLIVGKLNQLKPGMGDELTARAQQARDMAAQMAQEKVQQAREAAPGVMAQVGQTVMQKAQDAKDAVVDKVQQARSGDESPNGPEAMTSGPSSAVNPGITGAAASPNPANTGKMTPNAANLGTSAPNASGASAATPASTASENVLAEVDKAERDAEPGSLGDGQA